MRFFGGQNAAQHTYDNKRGLGYIEYYAKLQGNKRGRAPADLGHGRNNEMRLYNGEDGFEIADDARDVGNHILRKQDAAYGARLDAGTQRIQIGAAVNRQQTAHPIERKTKTQLYGCELGSDQY